VVVAGADTEAGTEAVDVPVADFDTALAVAVGIAIAADLAAVVGIVVPIGFVAETAEVELVEGDTGEAEIVVGIEVGAGLVAELEGEMCFGPADRSAADVHRTERFENLPFQSQSYLEEPLLGLVVTDAAMEQGFGAIVADFVGYTAQLVGFCERGR
jgi:hypothetical protein